MKIFFLLACLVLSLSGTHASELPDSPFIFRSKSAYYLSKTADFQQSQLITLPGQEAYLASPSPDGSLILYLSLDQETHSWNFWLKDLKKINLPPKKITKTDVGMHVYQYSWSPDSRFVIYESPILGQSAAALHRLDISSGEITRILPQAWASQRFPSYSPDGKWLTYSSDDKDGVAATDEIYVLSASGGTPINLTKNHEFLWEDINPSWSPDSRFIAFYRWAIEGKIYPGAKSGLWMINLSTKEETFLHSIARPLISISPKWSPDGKSIAVTHGSRDQIALEVINVEEKSARAIPSASGYKSHLYWDPNSQFIAFRNKQLEKRSLMIVSLQNEVPDLLQLQKYPSQISELIWIPE